MTSNFYRDFEDRYRGSRELVKNRQLVYLPFITPLTELNDDCLALDLGCGRGEWLEILLEHGFTPKGIDLDEGMLAACATLDLPAEKNDAITALRSQDSESLVLVSGFHIAEHLPFADLQLLISESLRVLKPGGLLILETPNAENLVVGTNNFYLDPTHERPIPHLLLSFMTEHCGFSRNKLLRLQESRQLLGTKEISLFNVLGGASPDYAIVAQKPGHEQMARFDKAFEDVHGLALDDLATRYDRNFNEQLMHLGEKAAHAEDLTLLKTGELADTLQHVHSELSTDLGNVKDELAVAIDGVRSELLEQISELSTSFAKTHESLLGMSQRHEQAVAYASALERRVSELEIRADLAEAALQKGQLVSIKRVVKHVLRPLVGIVMTGVLANPGLRKTTNTLIRRFPNLHQHLKKFAQHRGIIQNVETGKPYVLRPDAPGGMFLQFNPAVMPAQPVLPAGSFLELDEEHAAFSCIRFTGHIEGHYSLAIVNRGLAIALSSQLGDQLKFVPCHGKVYENPKDIPAKQASLLDSVKVELSEPSAEKILSIVHHYPMVTDAAASGFRMVLFFWEETAVPHDTIAFLNEHFDGILVATSFVKKVLQDSGCRTAIMVCPIGTDHLIDETVKPIGTLKPAEGTRFRFLHISSMFERKGPDVLIAAYLAEFSAHDNVELYIKTFPNPHNRVRELIAELSKGRQDLPSIIIDEEPMDDQQMVQLYRSSHTLVLPTRGEGFNLPAAEALAMALPVIVTGYGAHVDFCTLSTASLLPFSFEKSESHLSSVDACWVEPDRASLALQMREHLRKVLDEDAELERRRQNGLLLIRSTYTWEKSARAVLANASWAKKRMSRQAKQKTRLAVISPWSTRCGIAEYTQSLLSQFDRAHFDISILCDLRTKPNNEQDIYHPDWALGDTAAVKKALDRPACRECDVLVVQHQPSLFKLDDELCLKLAVLREKGSVVVLELHSTLPLIAEHRISEVAVQALRKLDRIIVHKPEDLNNLLVLGLVTNVMMMGHGVIQPLPKGSADNVRAELGIGENDLVIACFGFILPHKGIDTLVESILPLAAASGRRVHMLGLHSILDARSEQTLEAYRARAQELGVENNISWLTDYLPINESLRLMSAADYVIFPYKETRESASGAVTIGLATLKPVLVSPIHIFSDLADVTWRMGGSRPEDIVTAVMELEANPQLKADLVSRQASWTLERSWNRISTRLDNMIHSLQIDRKLSLATTRHQPDGLDNDAIPGISKLFVDVSELYFRDAKTGIQRVVKNVINELQLSENGQYQVVPVFGVSGHQYRYASSYPNASDFVRGQNEQSVTFTKGDVFLGLDLSAHLFPEFDLELERMKRAGVKIYFVVYDLIPLLYPRFAYPGIDHAFANWIRSLGRYADGLIGISSSVAADIKEWLLTRENMQAIPYVDYFHLGADIEKVKSAPPTDGQHELLFQALKERPSFLMVGTLEPRKGHEQTLAAFDLLWQQGEDVNLVLVGKEGWAVDRLAEQLRRHPMVGKKLFWLEGITDSVLATVYESCSCLLASSEAEGFGLPLIEAAQHGLPIIARDIPVFREVAGDHAFYFDGLQPAAIAASIVAWLDLYKVSMHPTAAELPWLHWRESVDRLKQIIFIVQSAKR